jgi:hypothetical protein
MPLNMDAKGNVGAFVIFGSGVFLYLASWLFCNRLYARNRAIGYCIARQASVLGKLLPVVDVSHTLCCVSGGTYHSHDVGFFTQTLG